MSNPITPTTPPGPVYISVTPTMIAINFGTTVQLVPVLTGNDGNPFAPTQPFVYSSSNLALLTIDSTGLCTAVTPTDPNILNTGGIVEINVVYPYQNRTDPDTINATSVIKVLAGTVVSAFVPQAPGVTLEQAETISGTPHGSGFKVISQS